MDVGFLQRLWAELSHLWPFEVVGWMQQEKLTIQVSWEYEGLLQNAQCGIWQWWRSSSISERLWYTNILYRTGMQRKRDMVRCTVLQYWRLQWVYSLDLQLWDMHYACTTLCRPSSVIFNLSLENCTVFTSSRECVHNTLIATAVWAYHTVWLVLDECAVRNMRIHGGRLSLHMDLRTGYTGGLLINEPKQ